jgi:hypothetical protein
LARADSDIYDFVSRQLTLSKRDFDAWTVQFEAAFRINGRVDFVVGVEHLQTTDPSEVRDYVDEKDLPITQTTRLRITPITASGKVFLLDRGRAVGQHAWIPAKAVPYVGAGGGVLNYSFSQHGRFVDYQDLGIFDASLGSGGWTPVVQTFAGLEINLNRRLFADAQIRYAWANAELGRDFAGFEKIDLSGLRATAGVAVRF